MTQRYQSDESVTDLIAEMKQDLVHKIGNKQAGIPTFFDNLLLTGMEAIMGNGSTGQRGVLAEYQSYGWTTGDLVSLLLQYQKSHTYPRLMALGERLACAKDRPRLPWEVDQLQLNVTSGVSECLHWQGNPLFKSVFDFAIYPMLLSELKPHTIIELGSGTGASALWLAQIASLSEADVHVYSVDLRRPQLTHDKVTFLEGNCIEIRRILPASQLERLPHPWLVIEDMHVDTFGVMEYFTPRLHKGDYFVVEDSRSKHQVLLEFMTVHPQVFKVDTRYTDFFGYNATCSADSIFVRT